MMSVKAYVKQKIKNAIFPELSNNIFLKSLALFTEMQYNIKFVSQYYQDMLAFLYFKGKKNGFFIDIGAYDGITINNTFIFEQIGWKGIAIEPQPDIFLKLQKNRTCDCYNIALSTKSEDSVDFMKVSGSDMLSRLNLNTSNSHKKRIKSEHSKPELIKVKTLTFEDLMKNYPTIKYIDFMSIDVEGSELDIIKTIDFNKYKFGLITIENPDKIKKYMKEKGYGVFLDNIGCDSFFVPLC